MKEILTLTGGYPRIMNFVLNLQSEMLALGNSLFGSLGFDLVLSGCTVTDNGNGTVNIAPGIIFVSGDTLRFDGANNQASDGSLAFAKGGYTTTNQVTFGDTSQKNVYREAKAVIVAADSTNIYQIKVKTQLYTLAAYIQDIVLASEVKGTIKEIYDFDANNADPTKRFISNFDVSGLGITARWNGWALMNANNGTPDAQGRATFGVGTYFDPITGEQVTYNLGDLVGARSHYLTTAEQATPAGLVTSLDGPHKKPSDGGGNNEYYVQQLSQASNATTAIKTISPGLVVYKVIKIA